MATRVRQNAWSLKPLQPGDSWDPVLEWYARAIADMRTRPISDPTSWRYQAAIHAYNRPRDPFGRPDDVLPSQADQERFWNQCQHASWFFLPWHRMYLGYFEQILLATIVRLGGPDDWALPYWNYSDRSNPNARKLPLAFTLAAMPDGTANPLRVDARLRGNDHEIVATPNEVNLRPCLIDPRFEASGLGGTAGFGGPQTGFKHSGSFGDPIGKLENTPHGTMHVAVGGFMGAFSTAGLDPMFWLHHANIDRLWVVWRTRNAQHRDPTKQQWLSGVTFAFHNAQGAIVTHTASQVVETMAALFDYQYDDVVDPLAGVVTGREERRVMPAGGPPEMVGASEEPVVLTGAQASTRVVVSAPVGPAARRAAGEPREAHLTIENVTGLEASGTYAVYLNVPEGSSPRDHEELLAGLVPTFGVPEATRGDNSRPADGLTFSLDVTDVVNHLEATGQWTGEVHVTFVPEGVPVPVARRVSGPEPITVGRVGLYYS